MLDSIPLLPELFPGVSTSLVFGILVILVVVWLISGFIFQITDLIVNFVMLAGVVLFAVWLVQMFLI